MILAKENSIDKEDKIVGYCKDQTKIYASCKIIYNPPINHIFGWKPDTLVEMLSSPVRKGSRATGIFPKYLKITSILCGNVQPGIEFS